MMELEDHTVHGLTEISMDFLRCRECFVGENRNEWCVNAAGNGHIKCLIAAHRMNCPWYEATCRDAACNGHLDCLRYAHEQGCAWDKYTCSNAAMHGRLDCLHYAQEQGCEWDGTYSDSDY